MADNAKTTATMVPSSEPVPYDLSTQKQLMDMGTLVLFMGAIMYFIVFRPQSNRAKAHRAMLDSMKKGSRIITGGGVHGTVHKIDTDEVVHVDIAPNVRIRVAKGSITEVVDESKAPASTANDN